MKIAAAFFLTFATSVCANAEPFFGRRPRPNRRPANRPQEATCEFATVDLAAAQAQANEFVIEARNVPADAVQCQPLQDNLQAIPECPFDGSVGCMIDNGGGGLFSSGVFTLMLTTATTCTAQQVRTAWEAATQNRFGAIECVEA